MGERRDDAVLVEELEQVPGRERHVLAGRVIRELRPSREDEAVVSAALAEDHLGALHLDAALEEVLAEESAELVERGRVVRPREALLERRVEAARAFEDELAVVGWCRRRSGARVGPSVCGVRIDADIRARGIGDVGRAPSGSDGWPKRAGTFHETRIPETHAFVSLVFLISTRGLGVARTFSGWA